MIRGRVTARHEARIPVTVQNGSQQAAVEALIDTGFDGALTLPPSLIAALGLVWRRRGRALLADGTESLFDVFEATVMWDGSLRRVSVDAVDLDPLVGMTLLRGYELTVQVVEGGTVTISALP